MGFSHFAHQHQTNQSEEDVFVYLCVSKNLCVHVCLIYERSSG